MKPDSVDLDAALAGCQLGRVEVDGVGFHVAGGEADVKLLGGEA